MKQSYKQSNHVTKRYQSLHLDSLIVAFNLFILYSHESVGQSCLNVKN